MLRGHFETKWLKPFRSLRPPVELCRACLSSLCCDISQVFAPVSFYIFVNKAFIGGKTTPHTWARDTPTSRLSTAGWYHDVFVIIQRWPLLKSFLRSIRSSVSRGSSYRSKACSLASQIEHIPSKRWTVSLTRLQRCKLKRRKPREYREAQRIKENLQQIVELSVNVPTDGHRAFYRLHVRLRRQDLLCLIVIHIIIFHATK